MESKLVFISLTLFFFNYTHAICVPRNRSTPSPSPDTPPNLKPVTSSSPKAPAHSSQAPKSSSSTSKAPTPSSPAPKSSSSSPKAPAPSSPSSSSSSSSSPKAPTPKSSSPPAPKSSSPTKAPTPSSSPSSSSPKAPTLSSPAPKSSPPSSSSPKASTPSSPQKSPSPASSTDSSPSKDSNPSTPGHSLFKIPTINDIKDAIPKLGDGNPAIKKICDSTDYPDVCLTTLGPLSGPANDVSSVLGVAIKAGSDFAKTALDTAEKLAGKPGTPLDVASSIKDCKDSYDDVSYNFQNAADALLKKDIGTMNTMLSAALTDVGDCQDAFQGQDSPLTSISDQLRKMASNCLAIVDLMNK